VTPTDIYSQLRRDEGVRNFPYTDTAGKLTIGVGRNLTDVGLRGHEIEYLLKTDIQAIGSTLSERFPWFENLDEPRQGVLLNMAFNLGVNGLDKFPAFLNACLHSNWEVAADEMRESEWARQVGDRAVRLSSQMRTGVWV
jgi:lysozyme